MQDMETPEALAAAIERGLTRIAAAVTPVGAVPSHDAASVSVGSLTEAVMGVTAGLVRVAEAISELADAVRDHGAGE